MSKRQHNSSLKMRVLSALTNSGTVTMRLIAIGRAFHNRGPPTMNERSPKLTSFVRGTSNRGCCEECVHTHTLYVIRDCFDLCSPPTHADIVLARQYTRHLYHFVQHQSIRLFPRHIDIGKFESATDFGECCVCSTYY